MLASLESYCNPRRPVDCRLVAQAHYKVAQRGRNHRELASAAPYCVLLPVDELARRGQLESCLAWLARVRVQQLQLGCHRKPLLLQQVQVLGHALKGVAPDAAGRVGRLVIMAANVGQQFDAGELPCSVGS